MKKIFTLLTLITSGYLSSQTSLQLWSLNPAQSNTVAEITNGMEIAYSTNPNAVKTVWFRFKNTAAVTNTYSVRRTDLVLNVGAEAYFCFGDLGSCLPANVTTPSSAADYCVLTAGAETTTLNVNSVNNNLSTDLKETTSTIGYSAVKYKLFNVATGEFGADTLTFVIKYNQFMGVNENSNVIENISDVYPNPSTNSAQINVVLSHESAVKVQVYNSLGSLVYNGSEQKLSGKNKLSLDCSNFNSGLYFVTVTANNTKITKRLVVNK